jgi:thiol-disulfide isomerase/thioredoxin
LLEPPPLVPLPSPGRSRSQVVRSGNQFTLADGLGRSRTFPSGREGDLLLIEFMTSSCIPCKQAAPGLNDLQRKYGAKGLEVIAVACDDEPYPTRVAVAERYRNDMNLLFGVYTETGKRPGELLKKFGVDRYPTAVLLDASGAVLWQGHPGKKETLIPTIEEALRQPAR